MFRVRDGSETSVRATAAQAVEWHRSLSPAPNPALWGSSCWHVRRSDCSGGRNSAAPPQVCHLAVPPPGVCHLNTFGSGDSVAPKRSAVIKTNQSLVLAHDGADCYVFIIYFPTLSVIWYCCCNNNRGNNEGVTWGNNLLTGPALQGSTPSKKWKMEVGVQSLNVFHGRRMNLPPMWHMIYTGKGPCRSTMIDLRPRLPGLTLWHAILLF